MTKTQAPLPRPPPRDQLPSRAQRKAEQKKRWVGLLFLFSAALLLWVVWSGFDSNEGKHKPLDHKQIETVVNRHLIMTHKKIELEQERAKLENFREIPNIGDEIVPRWKPNQVKGVDQSGDRNELNAVHDLAERKDLNLISPNAIIQSEIADTEANLAYEAQYKAEYAKRFIQNARAAGYDVRLDSNFRVISVQKIERRSGGQNVFETENGAAH